MKKLLVEKSVDRRKSPGQKLKGVHWDLQTPQHTAVQLLALYLSVPSSSMNVKSSAGRGRIQGNGRMFKPKKTFAAQSLCPKKHKGK